MKPRRVIVTLEEEGEGREEEAVTDPAVSLEEMIFNSIINKRPIEVPQKRLGIDPDCKPGDYVRVDSDFIVPAVAGEGMIQRAIRGLTEEDEKP